MDFEALLAAIKNAQLERGAARIAGTRDLFTDGVDTTAVHDAAMARFDELQGAAKTADVLEEMHILADVIDAVREHDAATQEAEAAAQAEADALTARIAGPGEPEATGDDTDPDNPGDTPGDDGTPPAAAVVPAQAPPPAANVPALVSARTAPRVPLRSAAKHKPPAQRGTAYELRAAADIRGISAGSKLDMPGFANATAVRLSSLRAAGPGRRTAGIMEIHGTGSQFVSEREETDEDVINAACDEKRLPGGSLVAAGGWCAPSEVLYDFCDTAVVDGLVNIPRIVARRGGLRWPTSPDFAAIYAGTGFCYTEAEVIGQTVDKPCYEVACTGFNECRLGVCGVCVKVPILTERGFPELVRYTLQQILAAHAHRMNMNYIKTMVAKSTAVTIPVGAAPFAYGPGATATALGAVELMIEYLRTKRRLGIRRTMEVVAPSWARGVFRSDLAKRPGYNGLNTTDAELDTYFRTRGANVQWVTDYQDAFSDPDNPPTESPLFGGPTAPLVWPSTLQVLIYPAGTFFNAHQDVISIDGLFDSALLAQNMHLALFSEEGWCVDKRCDESIALTMPICANGAVGIGTTVACPSV
jgi:hypothetical protein